MNDILTQMTERYDAGNVNDKRNALKEVMQEIVLSGLSRAGFFDRAAFYGGTALRIFYGLDRFSEDLDFSLMSVDPDFRLADYFPTLEREIASYGLNVSITEKEKTADSGIRSAFLKGNTREHILILYGGDTVGIAGNENIKIKFEVDTLPPDGAGFEHRYRLLPSPYEITLYDLPSLFAGKLHAVICRGWKSRVKGRDLYDFLFYMSRHAGVNLPHLKARLAESGVWDAGAELSIDDVKRLLIRRFETIDYGQARDDVRPFVRDPRSLELWCADLFIQATGELR